MEKEKIKYFDGNKEQSDNLVRKVMKEMEISALDLICYLQNFGSFRLVDLGLLPFDLLKKIDSMPEGSDKNCSKVYYLFSSLLKIESFKNNDKDEGV